MARQKIEDAIGRAQALVDASAKASSISVQGTQHTQAVLILLSQLLREMDDLRTTLAARDA